MTERTQPLTDPEIAEIRYLEGIRSDREVADEFYITPAEVRAIWNAGDEDATDDWDLYTEEYN